MSRREAWALALLALVACTRAGAPAGEDARGGIAEPPPGTPIPQFEHPFTPPTFPAEGEVRVESIAELGEKPTIAGSAVAFHPEACFVPREHPGFMAWLSLDFEVSAAGVTSGAHVATGRGRLPRAVVACLTAQLEGQTLDAHGRGGTMEVRMWLLGASDGGVPAMPPTTPLVVE